MSYLYQRGEITVDENFARFGAKSFAINKINSVEVRSDTKPASAAWVGVSLLAIILLLASDGNVVAITLGLLALVAAFFMWRGAKARTTHRLFLMTSSSEAQAYETVDADDIHNLRSAIEQAMTVSA